MEAAKLTFGIGVLLFFFSCFALVGATYLPWFGDYESQVYGFEALALGWLLIGGGCPAWLANPLMIVATVLMRFSMWSKAVVVATIAACFAPTILAFYSPFPPVGDKPEQVFCVGGWLWLSAIACMWASTIVACRSNTSPCPQAGGSTEHRAGV